MDNSIDFIKSVEIKHFLKMTGYKINLPFEAEFNQDMFDITKPKVYNRFNVLEER